MVGWGMVPLCFSRTFPWWGMLSPLLFSDFVWCGVCIQFVFLKFSMVGSGMVPLGVRCFSMAEYVFALVFH